MFLRTGYACPSAGRIPACPSLVLDESGIVQDARILYAGPVQKSHRLEDEPRGRAGCVNGDRTAQLFDQLRDQHMSYPDTERVAPNIDSQLDTSGSADVVVNIDNLDLSGHGSRVSDNVLRCRDDGDCNILAVRPLLSDRAVPWILECALLLQRSTIMPGEVIASPLDAASTTANMQN